MRTGALVAAALAVAVACVWGGIALWDTIVPGDLELDTERAMRSFDASSTEEAEEFEVLMRWLFIASQLVLVGVLVWYTRFGKRFLSESAAGPIGTGFLLGMMGIALVWLVQLPFGLVEIWWARKHDAAEVGYLEFVFGDFFGLAGEALFLCLLLLIVMALARLLRSSWWLPGVAVIAALYTLFAWVSPYLIFDLEEPSESIAADARPLAEKQGVSDVPVRIEDVHEYTDQPNAYALGLGDTRRIVLWNTLSDEFPDEGGPLRRLARVRPPPARPHREVDRVVRALRAAGGVHRGAGDAAGGWAGGAAGGAARAARRGRPAAGGVAADQRVVAALRGRGGLGGARGDARTRARWSRCTGASPRRRCRTPIRRAGTTGCSTAIRAAPNGWRWRRPGGRERK